MQSECENKLCLGSAIFIGLMLITGQGCIPIPVPSSPPSPTATAPVQGEASEGNKSVQLKVDGWWPAEVLGRYRANAGKVYVVVTVTVCNNTGKQKWFTADDFELVGNDNRVYSAIWTAGLFGYRDDRVERLGLNLLDGGYGTGDIIFEVGSSVKPVRVQYSPDW